VRGFVGRLEESGIFPHTHGIYLWTHLTFNIEYNGDQVQAVFTCSLFLSALLNSVSELVVFVTWLIKQ